MTEREFEFSDQTVRGETIVTPADGLVRFVYDSQLDDSGRPPLDVFGVRFRDAAVGPVCVLFTASQAAEVVDNLAAQLRNLATLRLEWQYRRDTEDEQ